MRGMWYEIWESEKGNGLRVMWYDSHTNFYRLGNARFEARWRGMWYGVWDHMSHGMRWISMGFFGIRCPACGNRICLWGKSCEICGMQCWIGALPLWACKLKVANEIHMHSSVSRKCECGVAFGIHGVIGIMNGMECMTVLDLVCCLWVYGLYMLYAVGMRCMVGDVRCCTTSYIPCAVLESSCYCVKRWSNFNAQMSCPAIAIACSSEAHIAIIKVRSLDLCSRKKLLQNWLKCAQIGACWGACWGTCLTACL